MKKKSNHLKMYLLTKMVVFHGHVSFQGGKPWFLGFFRWLVPCQGEEQATLICPWQFQELLRPAAQAIPQDGKIGRTLCFNGGVAFCSFGNDIKRGGTERKTH